MRTLEEAIKHAEYIVNNRKDAISICWSVKDCEQLAAWLRELQERRKALEIITCGECEKYDGMGFCRKHGIWVHNDDFCSFAERRTDD